MMVQEKCDLYKLEIYGLNQTSYSNNLLVELKQYLRNDLKLKFSNLEYNPQSQATVIFFQYKIDYDNARHVFTRKVQWRSFHFSVDSKPEEKTPSCDKKPVVPLSASCDVERPELHSNNNGTKEQMSQALEQYIQSHYPLLSVPYDTQLKGKQEHVLQTYASLFKQYANFKQLHTFQTFMQTKYGEARPFLFSGVVACPDSGSEEAARNLLELSVGTDVETNAISVGFPINDDPSLKSPCQVIPLRDVYSRHCFNIPKKFVTATEIIEKIIRSSGLQISINTGNSMGVWYRVSYRLHTKVTNPGTIHEESTPQLMIIFHIRPGYKLTPEIIDYISDIILDEVLSQNTVKALGLASVYIQRDHPITFQERTDSDEYLRLMEDHWKYLPEWWRLWGADHLEDTSLHLRVLPHSSVPASPHQHTSHTQALRELLVDVTPVYTIVDINCSTGILGGCLINKCKQLKFVTFNILTQGTIQSHLELLTQATPPGTPAPPASCDISRYKLSPTHYDTLGCAHTEQGHCIHCAAPAPTPSPAAHNGGEVDKAAAPHTTAGPAASNNHVKSSISVEHKIDIVSKVLAEATGDKVVVIYHYNTGDDFCDDFFKLIQYNTKIEKVLFVTDSSHNLNSNLIVQCIPYVMTHVSCLDALPHTHLYDVMILFERLEPNVSHDQVQLGFKFNEKQRLIEKSREEAARQLKERRATLQRLKAEAAAAPPPPPVSVATSAPSPSPSPSNHQTKEERYLPRLTYPPPPPVPSTLGPPPPRGSLPPSLPPPGLRFPPYVAATAPPPPLPSSHPHSPSSSFLPRALPPSRLPPPPSYGQRQRFGPPEVYGGMAALMQQAPPCRPGHNVPPPGPPMTSRPPQDGNHQRYMNDTDPHPHPHKRKPPPEPEPELRNNKKSRGGGGDSYLHHSASSSPSPSLSSPSPQVSSSSSFSHSSATQTGFQPYAKPYAFPPPPAHSNTPHSISDLTGKKLEPRDARRYPASSPKPPPAAPYPPLPANTKQPPSPYQPPLPPKQSPKPPPLPAEPPKDTKEKDMQAPMSYAQLTQADVLKLYEAQMAAYMPGASSADIGHLYAMQLAEAQMLQAAQAAQINSAQKLYAAQVASIEEQQKQYAMQVQAAHAQKLQAEKAAEAQMIREAQMKAVAQAHHRDVMKAQASLSAAGYPMSDAQKLQHNAQVQMMNEAAQHQKLQAAHAQAQQHMAADQMRKLYEEQIMYEMLAAQQQQALALGYPPQHPHPHPQHPRLLPMHPMYSSPLLYSQPAPPGGLPYDTLPPRPR